MLLSRKALDVFGTFEKAGFEMTLQKRLGLCKEHKLNGLVFKF
jgi:hypothetical protein